MCHLCMKLSNKFDPNQMCTSDKIVVKHTSVKETLSKLDLEPRVKVIANNRIILSKGTNIFDLLINRARLCLVTVLRLMSQTAQIYNGARKT